MAKVAKYYETTKVLKIGGLQRQMLELTADIKAYGDWAYSDFKANLYINNQFVAEIGDLLDKADIFTDLIDKTDWDEMLADNEPAHDAGADVFTALGKILQPQI